MSARPLAGLLATAALLALTGCGGSGGGEEAPPVDELVRRATERTGAVKSFHFEFDVENAPTGRPGLNLTFADGNLVVPDRLQAKVAGTLSGISLRSELIFVEDQHYLKDPFTGEWEELDAKTSPLAFFDPAKGVLSVIEGAMRLEVAGSEEVGGADTYRLKGVIPAREVTPILGNEPSDRLVDLELWIGKDDFRLRRIRLSGPIAPDEPSEVVRTVEVSGFDEPFTIEPPETGS